MRGASLQDDQALYGDLSMKREDAHGQSVTEVLTMMATMEMMATLAR
jgi:hypothetical protein